MLTFCDYKLTKDSACLGDYAFSPLLLLLLFFFFLVGLALGIVFRFIIEYIVASGILAPR